MTTLQKDPMTGTYIVKAGDNLSKIASSQGRTLAELLANNPQYAKNPNLIKPGDAVKVATASTPSYASLVPSPIPNTSAPTVPVASAPVAKTGPTSFTEALIGLLKDAQQNDLLGQQKLSAQRNTITKQGITDAERIFENKNLSPEAGTSLGLSTQNALDPLSTAITDQKELATTNMRYITDLYDKTNSAYQDEEDRKLTAQEKALDRSASAKKAASGGGSSTKGSITSGGVMIPASALAAGSAKLKAAKGADSYTDPYVYLQAYTEWPGLPQDFLSKFPPKQWLNPQANDLKTPDGQPLLPNALRISLVAPEKDASSDEQSLQDLINALNQ